MGTLYCVKCLNHSTTSGVDLSFHFAKKHSTTEPKDIQKNHQCVEDFLSFKSFQLHRLKNTGATRASEAKTFDILYIRGDVKDDTLQEELDTCKHSFIDSEMRHGDTEFLTLQWILCTRTWWLKSWIWCLLVSNVQNIWMLFLASFLKMWRLAVVVTKATRKRNTLMKQSELVATMEDLKENWEVGEQHWCFWILHETASKQKLDVFQTAECDVFLCTIQAKSCRLYKQCFSWSTHQKLFSHLFTFWKEHQKNLHQYFVSLQISESPIVFLLTGRVLINWNKRRFNFLVPT